MIFDFRAYSLKNKEGIWHTYMYNISSISKTSQILMFFKFHEIKSYFYILKQKIHTQKKKLFTKI